MLQQRFRKADYKPLSIAVITDGQASDPEVSFSIPAAITDEYQLHPSCLFPLLPTLQLLSNSIKDFARFIDIEAPKFGCSRRPRDYVGMQFVQIGPQTPPARLKSKPKSPTLPSRRRQSRVCVSCAARRRPALANRPERRDSGRGRERVAQGRGHRARRIGDTE